MDTVHVQVQQKKMLPNRLISTLYKKNTFVTHKEVSSIVSDYDEFRRKLIKRNNSKSPK